LLGSEGCSDGQRAALEATFGGKVYTWYGQTEKVLLGGECPRSRAYHLFPDYGVAELLDEDEVPITSPGVVGRLVGTGLLNICAPLVRYETGDLAEWADGCACGWRGQLISRVVGRTQDTLMTPGGAEVSVAGLNLHTAEYAHIERLQYRQLEKSRVAIAVVPTAEWSQLDARGLERAVAERLPGVAVEVTVVSDIRPDLNGKTPLVKRGPEVSQ
jgi:phenylacetate-CoA ligase